MARLSRREFLEHVVPPLVLGSLASLTPDQRRQPITNDSSYSRVALEIGGKYVTYVTSYIKRGKDVLELGKGSASDRSLFRKAQDDQMVPVLGARFLTVRSDLVHISQMPVIPPESINDYGLVFKPEGSTAPKRFDGAVTVFSQVGDSRIEADIYLLAPSARRTARFSRDLETNQINFDTQDAWVIMGEMARPLRQSLNVKLQQPDRKNGPFAVLVEDANIYPIDPASR